MSQNINPHKALQILYGLAPVESLEEAHAVIAWAEATPEALTNGQACRGLAALRQMAYGYLNEDWA